MIKILRQRNISYPATILLHKNGELLDDNFNTPLKVESPHNLSVSLSNINLTTRYLYTDSDITNTLKVQYVKIVENQTDSEARSNTQTRHFQMKDGTVNHFMKLNGLSRNAIYKIKMWAGSEFGYGPVSDEIQVLTNNFSQPRNFKVIKSTDRFLHFTWEKPEKPSTFNDSLVEYQIMIYSEREYQERRRLCKYLY